MLKRKKKRNNPTEVAESEAAIAQEAAEAPPLQPQVAAMPSSPTGEHWSLTSQWQKQIRMLRRELASSRKAFAKREKQWEKQRRYWERLEQQAFIGRFGPEGGPKWCPWKRFDHVLKMYLELWLLEQSALNDTREQWKSEVEMLEIDRDQLKEQVAALREQISELRAGPGHN